MTQDASETEMKKDQPNGEPLAALAAEFSKNVNNYLTHHVTIADAKAGVFLAADAVVATILIEQQFFSIVTQILLLLSLAALLLSGIAFTLVIFPRLPRGERGAIFWEDIRSYPSLEDYVSYLEQLSPARITAEYASQNYLVSHILHAKHVWLRRGIVLFGISVVLLLVAYVSLG